MYLVSEDFKSKIKVSHKMVALCEVLKDGSPIATLDIVQGNVTADATAVNRRRCDISLSGESNVPREITDLVHPLSGHELKLYRGIEFADGTKELVPQGVFGIEEADIADSGESLTIDVKGWDRSKRIERYRFVEPYFVAEGTNYATAIKDLIQTVLPGTVCNFTSTTHTTPPMIFGVGGWSGGGSPWESAQSMATSIGMELFFGVNGACRLQEVPDPSTHASVWTYEEGPEAMFLHLERGLTREGVFNGVIGFGLNTATNEPIRVEVWDDDPLSPTYYLGGFGKVPTFYRSTMLLTAAQVQEAAEARLRQILGTPEQISLTNIVNPAHEVGDIITIARSRIGINYSKHVIEKLNIPMTYTNVMNITCRESRA